MIERYDSLQAYCDTPPYQTWLGTWSPPAADVDHWADSEHEIDILSRNTTIREYNLTRRTTRLPFHLIDTVYRADHTCVDIGCGYNWFKRFYPNIWGVDPRGATTRDELLTPDWYRVNWGRWHTAFSINAMHFCDQTEIVNQVAKVRGILRPRGRAWVALNRKRIEERTPGYDSELLYHTLSDTPGLTRMVWMDEPASSSMDGNVWLWLEA